MKYTPALFPFLLRIADDRLILGHRTSEWCGHAPILEEDIALANIALDLIGQANLVLQHAGAVESAGRDGDALAFFRDAVEFRNALLCELPKGDFGVTIVRHFFHGLYSVLQWEALTRSTDQTLSGIAAKALKESRYHVRHAGEWMIRLGDGTEESHRRAQDAVDALWPYTGELFMQPTDEADLVAAGVTADVSLLEAPWRAQVDDVLRRATLRAPDGVWMQRGGRDGRHTEHLGHLLAEMQIVARSHPGAAW
ncbi:MAG: 1,2-phenylacetyl-CoA epoxidase subunit PaaC [Gemmatimonadaceae bacterium]|nr:1,2-phenylacetyl-CoA epoxidase subunit PaaC [Gemmatimonadaceae bacterium]